MEIKKELFGALVRAQLELKNPVRNKQGFNYSYSTLDSILEQVKPVLAKYGLVITQLLSGDGSKVGITTILAHSSGESIQETLWLPSVEMKSTNAVQSMGASISYGRRYGITSILGISSEEDTDAAEKTTERKETPPSPDRFKPMGTTSPFANGTSYVPKATPAPVVKLTPVAEAKEETTEPNIIVTPPKISVTTTKPITQVTGGSAPSFSKYLKGLKGE